MSGDELQRAIRAFSRRRPFRPYFIEFSSGDQLLIPHPEAVERHKELFLFYAPDDTYRIISAAQVCQVLDRSPAPPSR